ncbi:hypothetical protein LTR17_015564 [Elasticomyces elasticus]|nr:hypothetical protein LTR17_015564 [Elasticomyces elasticus]
MSLMGGIGHDTEEHYHGKVLDLLIPLLSSEAATSSNEALLATTVILRMSEQFSEVGNDCQRHLKGAAPLFMDGTDWSGIEINLATACFWTHHRESIRMSFLREQSFGFDFSHLSLLQDDMSLAASSEEVWTNRMTLLLLEIIKACWDEDGEGRPADHARLRTILQLWRAHLPLAFQPWCVRDSDTSPFPLIRCLSSWHIVAWQFYHTARVMLAVYAPEVSSRDMHRMREYMEVANTTTP